MVPPPARVSIHATDSLSPQASQQRRQATPREEAMAAEAAAAGGVVRQGVRKHRPTTQDGVRVHRGPPISERARGGSPTEGGQERGQTKPSVVWHAVPELGGGSRTVQEAAGPSDWVNRREKRWSNNPLQRTGG